MEPKEDLKSELMKQLDEFVDRPLNPKMVVEMHFKLMYYGMKKYPQLTSAQLNKQIQDLMFEVVKPIIDLQK